MDDNKERIIVINNIKGLFEVGNIVGSVIDTDESKEPSIEVHYIDKSLVKDFYNYKQELRNIFVEIIMSKTKEQLEKGIKEMIVLYYEVLRIEGYDKKLLTNYLFDAINEPHDIYQGNINDNSDEELLKEFEAKMKNKEFYYEIYKEMVVLLLPLLKGFPSRINMYYNLEIFLTNKLNIK